MFLTASMHSLISFFLFFLTRVFEKKRGINNFQRINHFVKYLFEIILQSLNFQDFQLSIYPGRREQRSHIVAKKLPFQLSKNLYLARPNRPKALIYVGSLNQLCVPLVKLSRHRKWDFPNMFTE